MTRRRLALLVAGLALAGALDASVRSLPGPVVLEVGAFTGPLLDDAWSAPFRAAYRDDVHPDVVEDGVTRFYFRRFGARASLHLPVQSRTDEVDVTLRADGGARCVVRLFVGRQAAGEVLVPPGPWKRHTTVLATPAGVPLDLGFALQPATLVSGGLWREVWLAVDRVEVASAEGFDLTPAARLSIAVVPLVLLGFALASAWSPRSALALAGAGAATTAVLAHLEPIPLVLAAPRLVPLAAAAGLGGLALARLAGDLTRIDRARLAGLVAVGTLAHASLVFFPNHNPPDLDTHAVRTADFAHTSWTRRGLMEYASQLPTASQKAAPATDLFGERALVPYSPLPYFAYYALASLGLDIRWAMTAVTTALTMLVAPLIWLVARHVWGRPAAWVAALLYALDLPVWHHVGRAHLPASFGNALGVTALLILVWKAERIDSVRRVLALAAILALGTLGYTSLALLTGLYGAILLALLWLDARALSTPARRGVALAFVAGGVLAGAVYYFHYVPGLLHHGESLESEAPQVFSPYTFLVFHNESRQSMRIWRLGSWWLVAAGLLAAPLALWRARATARPLLLAWLLTWMVFMILKEPFGFPRLLRWTKEEQWLSPLMDLMVAGGLAALPRAWLRWAAALIVLAWALRLAARDFSYHANSLAL